MTEDMPSDPKPKVAQPSNKLWKNLLYTFLGTTISIVLTFGTSHLVHQHRIKRDRNLSAMMVMGSVEKFAQQLEQYSKHMNWQDTLATYLLNIPMDSIDNQSNSQMLSNLPYVGAFPVLTYDQTIESIFNNSIEAWKNMGYIKFIENVGECFSCMRYIEEDYAKFSHTMKNILEEIMKHPEAYQGETPYSKCLHNDRYRMEMSAIHRYSAYCLYMAEILRYYNAVNMKILGVTEEEVKDFVKENKKEVEIDKSVPLQQDFVNPDICLDSLPDFETWLAHKQI